MSVNQSLEKKILLIYEHGLGPCNFFDDNRKNTVNRLLLCL